MKITTHGDVSRPCVTTLSTWDPFATDVSHFASVLRVHATREGLAAIPVIPDPIPASLLNGAANWAVYHDTETRIRMLMDHGMDGVAVLRMTKDDLARTAEEFFDAVAEAITPAEFWLRAGQSIGSGGTGNKNAVKAECTRLGSRFRMMPDVNRALAVVVRNHIGAGSVAGAAEATGIAPIVRKPAGGTVRLAWPVGGYLAEPRRSPGSACGEPLPLELTADPSGMAAFAWPDPAAEFLAFTAGPADLAAGAEPGAAVAGAGR